MRTVVLDVSAKMAVRVPDHLTDTHAQKIAKEQLDRALAAITNRDRDDAGISATGSIQAKIITTINVPV